MPLSVAKVPLKFAIYDALEAVRTGSGFNSDDARTPSTINLDLATALANAIHNYTVQAIVTTSTVSIVVGVVVAGIGAPGAVAGGSSGTGSGFLS